MGGSDEKDRDTCYGTSVGASVSPPAEYFEGSLDFTYVRTRWRTVLTTNNHCPECQRLWGEYVSAMLEHVRLDRQLYFVTLGQESGSIPTVRTSLGAATLAKDSLRELIGRHEQDHRKAQAAPA